MNFLIYRFLLSVFFVPAGLIICMEQYTGPFDPMLEEHAMDADDNKESMDTVENMDEEVARYTEVLATPRQDSIKSDDSGVGGIDGRKKRIGYDKTLTDPQGNSVAAVHAYFLLLLDDKEKQEPAQGHYPSPVVALEDSDRPLDHMDTEAQRGEGKYISRGHKRGNQAAGHSASTSKRRR